MTLFSKLQCGAALFAASSVFAAPGFGDTFKWSVLPQISEIVRADIVVFGELHDNPTHHARQAHLLHYNAQLEGNFGEVPSHFPVTAIVFEMLTTEQAAKITPALIEDEAALEEAIGWEEGGWPDFSMYYPIFAARPETPIFGAAVPRDAARTAMQDGVVRAFGPEAYRYHLHRALNAEEMEARLALQAAAHCNAMPEEMLPAMVDIQRLRDARLAQVALEAFDTGGGPVLVITGNGHARKDWGMPLLLQRVRPGASVFVIQQGEDGATPDGGADLVLDAPAPTRGDPCEAFRK